MTSSSSRIDLLDHQGVSPSREPRLPAFFRGARRSGARPGRQRLRRRRFPPPEQTAPALHREAKRRRLRRPPLALRFHPIALARWGPLRMQARDGPRSSVGRQYREQLRQVASFEVDRNHAGSSFQSVEGTPTRSLSSISAWMWNCAVTSTSIVIASANLMSSSGLRPPPEPSRYCTRTGSDVLPLQSGVDVPRCCAARARQLRKPGNTIRSAARTSKAKVIGLSHTKLTPS